MFHKDQLHLPESQRYVSINGHHWIRHVEPGTVGYRTEESFRLTPIGHIESSRHNGQWVRHPDPLGILGVEVRKAITKLWPATFDDGAGDIWAVSGLEGDSLISQRGSKLVLHRKERLVVLNDLSGPRSIHIDTGLGWMKRVVRHFWPEMLEKVNSPIVGAPASIDAVDQPSATSATSATHTKKPLEPSTHWSFKAPIERVDIPRILREAFEAGAREVTFTIPGLRPVTCIHREVWGLCRAYVTANQLQYSEEGMDLTQPDWIGVPCGPILAAARKWREKNPKPVYHRVTVVGVK
jgi:hypothetical protein